MTHEQRITYMGYYSACKTISHKFKCNQSMVNALLTIKYHPNCNASRLQKVMKFNAVNHISMLNQFQEKGLIILERGKPIKLTLKGEMLIEEYEQLLTERIEFMRKHLSNK